MVQKNITQLLEKNTTLEIKGIDRLYLNLYHPILQSGGGITHFFQEQRGAKVASSALMGPMTKEFVNQIHQYIAENNIEKVKFTNKMRKDDETQKRLKNHDGTEGVLYIGVAQEKVKTFRTTRRKNEKTGIDYVWLMPSSVMCNQYYFYIFDDDFGPMFIKFSSYFPYTGRVCINGHEYLKRQLYKKGVAYEALDNGLLSREDPKQAQKIMDTLNEHKIQKLVNKWLKKLPSPFLEKDYKAGFRYQVSILQAEFATTQVFDRPLSGRLFFEAVIKENIDPGRPENVSLIFGRSITKKTPGQFKTRIVQNGVVPSINYRYKSTQIKQYFKEGRALRTETTINNTKDFYIGRSLHNLPLLKDIGFKANEQLLKIQKVSQNCQIGEEVFNRISTSQVVNSQRASALKFGDPRVMALYSVICMFAHQVRGFSNSDIREQVASLMGKSGLDFKPGHMTYDLRRLRLHGIIERIEGSYRYNLTDEGMKICLFMTKIKNRIFIPGLSVVNDVDPEAPTNEIGKAMRQLNKAINQVVEDAKLVA